MNRREKKKLLKRGKATLSKLRPAKEFAECYLRDVPEDEVWQGLRRDICECIDNTQRTVDEIQKSLGPTLLQRIFGGTR